ncbi:50S ribosomal protein L23 [Hydrogenobaculum acidophilum]
MRAPEEVIIRPIITEKTNRLMEDLNKYVFEVHKDANKHEIKHAVEKLFGVKVKAVNTLYARPRVKRTITKKGRVFGTTRGYKKAIITLDKNSKIDLMSL